MASPSADADFGALSLDKVEQLKIEEGMGKQVKQIPKIIDALKKQVKAWEKTESATFFMKPPPVTVNAAADDSMEDPVPAAGRPCLEVIDETEDKWSRRKEQAAEAKKAAKTRERDSGTYGGSAPFEPKLKGKRPKSALGDVSDSRRNSEAKV